MKSKSLVFMFFTICSILLVGCKKFPDSDQSIWGGALWIIPWLTGLGALTCYIISYVASRSGSKKTTGLGMDAVHEESDQNVPMHKVAYFPWAVGLTIITILIIGTVYVTG